MWNSAFHTVQFWDGRAADRLVEVLEEVDDVRLQPPEAVVDVFLHDLGVAAAVLGHQEALLPIAALGQGLGWSGDDFSKEEKEAVRGWLGGKAFTIYGGSQEVQSNIISKRILGTENVGQSGIFGFAINGV